MNTQTNEVAAPASKAKVAKKAKAAATTGPVIKLTDKKPEYKDGSARALWLAAVSKYNGKTAEEFCAAAAAKPPVLTKGGKAEHPAGWLRYFEREGILTLAKHP